jgi:ATP-dependent helicase/DNAse subunit B
VFQTQTTFFPPGQLILLPNDLVRFQFMEGALAVRPVLLNPLVWTFSRLEKVLSAEFGPPLVDDWSRRLALNKLAPDLWDVLGLPGQPEVSRVAELAEELGDGLDRLRLSGLTWAEIAALEPRGLSTVVADLGQRYDKWLGARDDQFSRRLKLLKAIKDGHNFRALAPVTTIICEHNQRLSPFEAELLKALAQGRGREVKLRLEAPDWLKSEEITSNVGYQRLRVIKDFERRPDLNISLDFTDPQAPAHPEVPEALRFAAENLFGPPVAGLAPAVGEALAIIKTPTRYHEVEEAARRVKGLIVGGVAPHHIALAAPELESYQPIIEDVGRRFGLDFYFRRGSALRIQGPVLAIGDLLSLWGSNWERSRILRVLESPYFDFGLANNPRVDLLKAGVTDERAGGGFEDNESKYRHQNNLEELAPKLAELKKFEDDLKASKSWAEFLTKFNGILGDLKWGTPESRGQSPPSGPLQDLGDYAPKIAADQTAIDRFRETLETLSQALAANSPETPPVSLAQFKLWLNKALSDTYLGSPKSMAGRVLALNYYDLHGAFFEALFLLGLNAQVFPRAKAEACWWPESFIKSLAGTKLGRSLWTGAAERYQQEEEIVSLALAQARKVCLSYYAFDDHRRQVLASPIVDSLKALWPEGIKEEVVPWPLPPKPEMIRDKGELWLHLASKYNLAAEPPGDLDKFPPYGDEAAGLWKSLAARCALEPKLGELPKNILTAWLAAQEPFEGRPLLSLTPLTDYAECPRKFLFGQILGLGADPDEIESRSPLDRGNLIHTTLERFFEPYLGQTLRPAELNLAELMTTFDQVCAEDEEENPVGRRPLWETDRRRLAGQLGRWLEGRKAAEDNFMVEALEWRFGQPPPGDNLKSPDSPPLPVPAAFPAFYLKGRLDRLDRVKGGLVVLDYKNKYNSGYKPPKEDEPTPLKYYPLIMYCLAAKRHFGSEARGILDFIDPGGENKPFIEVEAKGEELFVELWENLHRAELGIPEKVECRYCEYFKMCRGGPND